MQYYQYESYEYGTCELVCINNIMSDRHIANEVVGEAVKEEETAVDATCREAQIREQVASIIAKYDDNCNGVLEWEEFLLVMQAIDPKIKKKDMLLIFDMMDADGSGDIDAEELGNYLAVRASQKTSTFSTRLLDVRKKSHQVMIKRPSRDPVVTTHERKLLNMRRRGLQVPTSNKLHPLGQTQLMASHESEGTGTNLNSASTAVLTKLRNPILHVYDERWDLL